MVSIDQYVSAALGLLLGSNGKEPKKDKYCGSTLFVDHASGKIFGNHQVSLRAGETVLSKRKFEWLSAEEGVRIKGYHVDNDPFDSQEFRADVESKQQKLVLSGTGAHHQNGVSERSVRTVVTWARTMMLNAILHWSERADLSLWPFALDYAIFVWNTLPNRKTQWSPNVVFSSSRPYRKDSEYGDSRYMC
jgi:hypothetical protein